MTRTTWLILAAIGVIGALIAGIFALSASSQPEEEATPTPVVTIEPGAPGQPAPTPTETAPAQSPEAGGADEGEAGGDQDGEHAHEEGDAHDHVEDDCENDPFITCDDTGNANTTTDPADDAAAQKYRSRALAFVTAWATTDMSEKQAARTKRLAAAGATGDVLTQASVFERRDTSLSSLTGTSTPDNPTRALFVGRESGLLHYRVSLNVTASYRQVDGTGSNNVAGGYVDVYVDDAKGGTVAKVAESFPTIANLR